MNKVTQANLPIRVAILGSFGVAFMIGFSGMNTPTANALSLGDINVGLPLGKLGEPVTDLLNPITESLPIPISLDSTPAALNVDVTPPSLKNDVQDDPALSLDLQLPQIIPAVTDSLSQVTTPILQPVSEAAQSVVKPLAANVIRPITQPLTSSARRSAQQSSAPLPTASAETHTPATLAVATIPSTGSLAVIGGTAHTSEQSASSPFVGITNFFSSALTNALSKLSAGIAIKDVNTLPIIISALIFLFTIVSVGTIVYTTNYGGALSIGRYNLTKFARAHDVVQLTALAVVTVSFSFVAILLSLTIL